jgi:hypothetical protein
MSLKKIQISSLMLMLLILKIQSFSTSGTDAPVIGLLNQIDDAVKLIKDKVNNDATSNAADLKTWCDSLMSKCPYIYTILNVDNNGAILFEDSRYKEKSLEGGNVSKSGWFSNTIGGSASQNVEIVKIGSKRILLNSWVSGQKVAVGGVAVAAVLIDLETVLASVNTMLPVPAALVYNGKTIYESNWVQDAGKTINSPQIKGLGIAVMNTNDHPLPNATLIPSISLTDENRLFLGIAIVSLLIGISGIILFIVSQSTASKLRNDSYLKLEEEKLSDQEKEKIHNLAVSHVYCEIKRQVETHELHDIESQVRHEIETSVRNKPILLDPVKTELTKTVINN